MTIFTAAQARKAMGKTRAEWPFKSMQVGQIATYKDREHGLKAQSYAHTYGRYSLKKFRTWTDQDGIHIERLN